MRSRMWIWAAMFAALALLASGCGDDDDTATTTTPGGETPTAGADGGTTGDDSAGDDGAPAPPAGGGGGELVIGDETIVLDSARCYLQEQDAAAGGGKILFVAQGFGTNAAGEEVALDVSRYDEDSQFTGDSIIVDIGDPFSPDAVSMDASSGIGTVSVDGSTVSADGLSFLDFETMAEHPGSFRINC